jgi:glucokinase
MQHCVIGVDLGGTNVRAGAFYPNGDPAGEEFSNPSSAQDGTETILNALAGTINQAISAAKSEVKAIGLAIPGHIDNSAGVVRWAPNFGKLKNGAFEYWENVPIREPLQKLLKTDLPIMMDNDANMAALGEYRYGSGKNSASAFVMLTLGTGIGGGVILSPESVLGNAQGPLVLVGGNKGGAELGHVVIDHNGLDCNAGTYGTVEAYCQRDAIVRRAVHQLVRGRKSLLRDMVQGDYNLITPLLISEAANKGDDVAIETFEEIGTMLGVAIGNYINIFAPEIVAIGGQISKAGELIMKSARHEAMKVAIASLYRDCKIMVAEKAEDAGMLGGAALAEEGLKWKQN